MMNLQASKIFAIFALCVSPIAFAEELCDPVSLSSEEIEALVKKQNQKNVKSIASSSVSGFSIDRTDRFSVLAGYHEGFVPSEDFANTLNWNGDVDNCVAGTTSAAFKDDVLRRVNYLRAMAGLSSNITFDSTKNAKCQEAALIMSRQGNLSHTPNESFPLNACLTDDGDEAAGQGNLSLGRYGPGAILRLLIDDGSNNAAAGHRRWILYSRAQEMGTGDIPENGAYRAAHCSWVIGDFTPVASPAPEIAWPPEGFVPYDIVPNDSYDFPRWSFGYPGANFNNSTVTMTQGGTQIPVALEAVSNGFGDNTLVWRPSGIPSTSPASDTTYTVSISGIANAPFTSRTYDVTLIDPYDLGTEVSVSGDASPAVGLTQSYTFNTISGATSYEARIAECVAGNWIEGAESSPAPQVLDQTDSSYDLLDTNVVASGSRSFHLTTPSLDSEDRFTIDRDLIPEIGSQIQFKYLRRWMSASTFLVVELSTDGGDSFAPVHSIPGASDGNSSTWDSSYISASVNIPTDYVGYSTRLRFRLERIGSAFLGTTVNHGLHIDDIMVTNHSESLSPTVSTLGGGASSFDYTPTTAGTVYALSVSPELGGRLWGDGPILKVSPQASGLSVLDLIVNEDAGAAYVAVTLSAVQASDVTFSYVTSNQSAVGGSDFTAVSGSATIPAGEKSVLINVPIIDDAATESDETFLFTISNPTGGVSLGNASATITIDNDPGSPTATDFGTFASAYGIPSDDQLDLDTDGDGISDYAEWALGASDPVSGNALPECQLRFVQSGGDDYFLFCYQRLSGGVETGAVYQDGDTEYELRGTRDLVLWNETPVPVPAPAGLPTVPGGYEWGAARLPFDISEARGFLSIGVNP